MTDFRYPNEPEQYRARRDALLDQEVWLRDEVEKVAAARRELPPGGRLKQSYEFERMDAQGEVRRIPFAELFGGHDTLILYSMMYGPAWDAPCPSCTSIVDGIQVSARTVMDTAGLAVVVAASAQQIRDWSVGRGWTELTTVSGQHNDYMVDYAGFVTDDPAVVSAMNVFRKSDAGIFHFWGSELVSRPLPNGHPRHVDMIWPLWNLLDLTPEGRGTAVVPRQNYQHQYFSKHLLGEDDPGDDCCSPPTG